MKLTEESRQYVINLLIEDRISNNCKEGENALEGLKINYHCMLNNGCEGYSKYSDFDLLDELVFLRWGFDLQWEKAEKCLMDTK